MEAKLLKLEEESAQAFVKNDAESKDCAPQISRIGGNRFSDDSYDSRELKGPLNHNHRR